MTLATPLSSRPAVYPESSRRVLLVDSTKELRLHLAGLLRSAGYELMVVDSVLAARVALARARPLLVLVDWRTLSLDGGPGCALLRNRAGMMEVPLLLVAGPGTPAELLEQGLRGGLEDCVLAPVRGAELLARLSALRDVERRKPPRVAEHRTARTVLVVGDAMVDRYVYGSVTRVSPEAPVPVLSVEREVALPGDPPGELEVVDGPPEGGKIHDLTGMPSAFTPRLAALITVRPSPEPRSIR